LNTSLVFGIWSLIYFVSFAFRNYKREEIDKLKAERSLKDSELARLRSQMNPHFVFNALNSIRGLVMENPSQAQEAITQLSYLLRNFLNTENVTLTTLSNEIKTVQDYLNLEKLRYEARLKFEIDIAPETLSIPLPTMMVQTLVENAVKHGISNSIEGGTIAIRSSIEENKLIVSVANTGTLGPRREGPDAESGFGIKSSEERLNLQYGNEANLRLEELNGNVVATIALPITKL
jgi:LytS/YehU family sensor histidine kinase